jgi:hypothetical protein
LRIIPPTNINIDVTMTTIRAKFAIVLERPGEGRLKKKDFGQKRRKFRETENYEIGE